MIPGYCLGEQLTLWLNLSCHFILVREPQALWGFVNEVRFDGGNISGFECLLMVLSFAQVTFNLQGVWFLTTDTLTF